MKPVSICCPHCDGLAQVRTSKSVTRLVRESYLQCRNVECGHTFVAQMVIVRTLSPSAAPRADVHIPMAPAPDLRRRRPAAANDDAPSIGEVAIG